MKLPKFSFTEKAQILFKVLSGYCLVYKLYLPSKYLQSFVIRTSFSLVSHPTTWKWPSSISLIKFADQVSEKSLYASIISPRYEWPLRLFFRWKTPQNLHTSPCQDGPVCPKGGSGVRCRKSSFGSGLSMANEHQPTGENTWFNVERSGWTQDPIGWSKHPSSLAQRSLPSFCFS